MFNVRRRNASSKQQQGFIAYSIIAQRFTSGEQCRAISKTASLLGTIAFR